MLWISPLVKMFEWILQRLQRHWWLFVLHLVDVSTHLFQCCTIFSVKISLFLKIWNDRSRSVAGVWNQLLLPSLSTLPLHWGTGKTTIITMIQEWGNYELNDINVDGVAVPSGEGVQWARLRSLRPHTQLHLPLHKVTTHQNRNRPPHPPSSHIPTTQPPYTPPTKQKQSIFYSPKTFTPIKIF